MIQELSNALKEMTLDEKLAAIDLAIANAPLKINDRGVAIPVDPADLTMCEGCQ